MQDYILGLQRNMRITYLGRDGTITVIGETKACIEFDTPSDNPDGKDSSKEELILSTKTLFRAYRTGELTIKPREPMYMQSALVDAEEIKTAERILLFLFALRRKTHHQSRKTIEQVISEVTKEHQLPDDDIPSISTLRDWYRIWESNAYDIVPVVKSQYRRRKSQFCEASLKLFDHVLYEEYLTFQGPSISECHRIFTQLCEEQNIARIMSKSRFYEVIKSFDPIEVIRAREGETAARKFARLNKGHFTPDYPLQDVEIDAVWPAVGLLDDETLDYIGVPIVYLAIDRRTRVIVGYAVSFGIKPAEISKAVVELVKQCVTLKEKPSYTNNGWPLSGIPYKFIGDAGTAFMSNAVFHLMAQIRTSYVTTKVKSPWSKPFIESFNRTIRFQCFSKMPGYQRVKGNEDVDYGGKVQTAATLTLSEFIKILEIYILDQYHQNPHRGLQGQTPQEVCDMEREKFAPRLLADMNTLDALGGSEFNGTIQPSKGLQKNNVFYHDKRLQKLYFELRKQSKKAPAKVTYLYDTDDISKISVVDEFSNEIFVVEATTPDVTSGMSLAEFQSRHGRKPSSSNAKPFTAANTVITGALKRQALEKAQKRRKQLEAKAKKQQVNKQNAGAKDLGTLMDERHQHANRDLTDVPVNIPAPTPSSTPITKPLTR